jgi:hypothetical protein
MNEYLPTAVYARLKIVLLKSVWRTFQAIQMYMSFLLELFLKSRPKMKKNKPLTFPVQGELGG